MDLKLVLVDINSEVIDAWEKEFSHFDGVFIQKADILEVAENTIVSPANSRGYMDGGIDRSYSKFFGERVQKEILKRIDKYPDGLLPVGSSILMETEDFRIPYMIVAPTMTNWEDIPIRGSDVFFTMSAILNIASKNTDKITSIYCPGLGTGIGRVLPGEAAKEMSASYKKWIKKCKS